MLEIALERIHKMLQHGVKYIKQTNANPFLAKFVSLGGANKVKELQNHGSESIRKLAYSILNTF